jgi:Protein of unknown function (DUF1573)
MRRFKLSVVILLSIIFVACVTPRQQIGPKALLTDTSKDLGAIAPGEKAEAEFSIRNDGDAPLRILKAKAPRGVAVEGLPLTVESGKTSLVRVTVDTSKFAGKVDLPVTLESDGPRQEKITLQIKLEVRPFLLVRPGYARFITVQKAREGTISQTLGSSDDASFRVLGVESPYPHLRVAWREVRPEQRRKEWTGRQWIVDLTLSSDSPVGHLEGHVVVRTDHPRQKSVFIPLSGFVRPVFAVTPPGALLGEIDPARAVVIKMQVKNFAEELIEVTGASTDVAGVSAGIRPIEAGRSWSLRLTFDKDMASGPFQGKILIRTASPKAPVIEVPLSGKIVPKPSGASKP